MYRFPFFHFKEELTPDSELFQQYGPLWGNDMTPKKKMDTSTQADELFQDLKELESFEHRHLIKSSRWFSLNENIEAQKTEHWAFKALLKHHHKSPFSEETFIDPYESAVLNPRRELSLLRGANGAGDPWI